jgi:phosphoserine phosphatase
MPPFSSPSLPLHFLFDFDGTLTREELLPKIAREIGLEAEMAELTRLTMAGDIPFEHSFRERVKKLQFVPIQKIVAIVEEVQIEPSILSFLQAHADRAVIVTGNLDVWIGPFCEARGLRYHASKARHENGYVTGIDHVLDKGDVADAISRPFVAVGEGHNDLPMFEKADIAIAYGGVHAPARALLEVASHAIYDGKTLCRFLTQL